MMTKKRSWIIVSIAFVLIASSLFSRLPSSLPPCTPTPRPVLNSALEFDQLWTVCAGLSSTVHGIVIGDDKVIVGDYTRNALVAFDLVSGAVGWQTPMQGNFALTLDKARQRLYTYVIYGTSREIYAVNTHTGDVVWRNDDDNGTKDSHTPFLLADGQMIAVNYSEPARQVNVDTGALGVAIAAVSLRIFPDGHAWIVQKGTLTAINALSGEIVWQVTAPNISDERCLDDVQVNQTTVLAKICGQLAAYDFTTHALRWTQNIPHIVGDAAVSENRVYVVDGYPTLHVLRLDDGVSIGKIQFEPMTPSPDSAEYAGDQNNRNWIVASGDRIAIYFGDTNMVSVYRIQ
ncbi:MAG: PQQ-binding-like beta-propeller repeat protein [Chloroflexota bacterium]